MRFSFFVMTRTLHTFARTFRSLSFRKMIKLIAIWCSHPLLAILSVYATFRAFRISARYFPKTHGSNKVGNAFRHALWSCLVMMYCCKISSPNKSLNFCKKITDFHEKLFPNEPMETQMDLHNNQVGMALFMQMLEGVHRQFFETHFFVDELLKKVETAQQLSTQNKTQLDSNELVYLEVS